MSTELAGSHGDRFPRRMAAVDQDATISVKTRAEGQSMTSTTTPVSYKIAAVLAGLYGLVAIAGGIVGFASKGSVISLVAGGVSGLLLLLCAYGVFRRPAVALAVSAVIAIALLGQFARPVLQSLNESQPPANAFAWPMAVGGLVVLLASGFALAGKARGG
jgi:uncharacterized membrane protein (UPF0136 family)